MVVLNGFDCTILFIMHSTFDLISFLAECGCTRPARSAFQSKSNPRGGSFSSPQQIIGRFHSGRYPVRFFVRHGVSDGCQLDSAGGECVGLGDRRRCSFATRQRIVDFIFAVFAIVIASFILAFVSRRCSVRHFLCRSRYVACARFVATTLDHAVDRRWRECFSQRQRLGHAHTLVLVVFANPVHVECGRSVGNPSPEQRKF
jgi:hypothetical protein